MAFRITSYVFFFQTVFFSNFYFTLSISISFVWRRFKKFNKEPNLTHYIHRTGSVVTYHNFVEILQFCKATMLFSLISFNLPYYFHQSSYFYIFWSVVLPLTLDIKSYLLLRIRKPYLIWNFQRRCPPCFFKEVETNRFLFCLQESTRIVFAWKEITSAQLQFSLRSPYIVKDTQVISYPCINDHNDSTK